LAGADSADNKPWDAPVMREFSGTGALLVDYIFAFESTYHGGINVGTSLDNRGLAWVLAAPARARTPVNPAVNIFNAAFTQLPQGFSIFTPGTNTSDPNFANGVSVGG